MNSVRIPLSQYDLIVELRPLAPAPAPGKRTRRAPRLTTPATPEYIKKVLLQLPEVVSVACVAKEKA